MIYVIDTSVAFKWVVPETASDKALLLRDDFRNAIHELQATAVFSIELAHALTRAERQGRIPVGKARVLWGDVMTLPPRLFADGMLVPRAIDISSAPADRRLRLRLHRAGRTGKMRIHHC